ncbi:MAG: Uma2 family endonuclease [bacterium]|nr:Uma2 family endonuclease [bacterium]
MLTPVILTDAPRVMGPPQGQWTAADWETLPDDGNRYEIIDGVLYMSTAPSFFHQWIIFKLHELVGIPAQAQQLAFGIGAPIGVFMPGAEPVQPDYLIVLMEHRGIIRDRRIYGVPDLIVEVISPGSEVYDREDKLKAYAMAGVPEYGLVDPRSRTLTHHRLHQPGQYHPPTVYSEGDRVTFDCLPSLSFPLGDLFAGAPDTTL